MKSIDPTIVLRYIGSITVIIGYFILLNYDVLTGVSLRLIANSITLPWAIKYRVWDLIVILVFFSAIDLHQLIILLS
jgi:hypothetical protein